MTETENAFTVVSSDTFDFAKQQCLQVLNDGETPDRIRRYYDVDTNYAGATFASLKPNRSDAITATDLLAVTTLSVDIPVLAIRRVLESKETQDELRDALESLPNCSLEETNEQDFPSMERFYDLVKSLLAKADTKSSNPWVTASKIVARKRPNLFPVRDRVVCDFLGISRLNDRAKDWVVFRELMRDEDIRTVLGAKVAEAEEMKDELSVSFDSEPLRQLDVALWMAAPKKGRQ
ncbi:MULTISPECIES: DUF6308 family protein [unclassified Brevibacterium]|uniref:DUF6308 family protein n=1 Tax=unclassified Brevibacterium TaxID=2614124 RepID=UPI001E31F8BC|nr:MULTISPECIES: DUF6308 family protein [unclassified Brevibacterium]MCD1286011.1 hypothetical protein [Brevibacterium sp. CCUG 69071]MDK8435077.1 DUF6308 family protein [Brevibacterium sp. H-BE7]